MSELPSKDPYVVIRITNKLDPHGASVDFPSHTYSLGIFQPSEACGCNQPLSENTQPTEQPTSNEQDIVERLRNYHAPYLPNHITAQAADEIERLRRELRGARNMVINYQIAGRRLTDETEPRHSPDCKINTTIEGSCDCTADKSPVVQSTALTINNESVIKSSDGASAVLSD